jgi:enoyl-CoA hydratase
LYEKYKYLRFDRRGTVLTVTIDNPPLNAASPDVHDELTYVFDDIGRDDDCHVAVLTGEGRAFSAGGDFAGMLQAQQSSELREYMMARAPHMVHSMLGLDKPLIARVNGHAMGLGATLALMCDVVFAVESAKFADPHINVGLSTGDGGAIIWPHLIGYARARHHLLTGEPLTGTEAAQIGLIHKAVAAETLDEEVYAYADRLASGPTMAVRATKRSINMALVAQAAAQADAHIGLELRTLSSQDHREAILAIMEKRAPVYTGK